MTMMEMMIIDLLHITISKEEQDDQDEDYEDDGDVDRGLKLRGEEAVKQVQ